MELDDLKPCRFCGSTDLLMNLWSTEEGEVDAVECSNCLAGAPLDVWQTDWVPDTGVDRCSIK